MSDSRSRLFDHDRDQDHTVALVTIGRTGAAPAIDSERTVALPQSGGTPPSAAGPGNLLPVGTRMGEFEIAGLVGEGGFGIVYRATDLSLGRTVALKEYMPSALASRTRDLSVSVKSDNVRETFRLGLHSFVNEARMLAQFDHAALVKVFRFWEANGTAYMAMPLYDGVTLKQALKNRAQPPDEAWLRRLLAPLLDALELLHKGNCLHRDVSPDNIILLPGDLPVLLDFGAARRVIGDATQALTVILKPGFAPVEQYDEIPGMKQGAWTDLYALGAVIHFAITGRPPAPAVGRMVRDVQLPLSRSAAGRYGPGFLAAIDRMLAPLPVGRPQSVGELRAWLRGDGQLPAAVEIRAEAPGAGVAPAPGELPRTVVRPMTSQQRALAATDGASSQGTAGWAAVFAAALTMVAGGWAWQSGLIPHHRAGVAAAAPVLPPVQAAPQAADLAPSATTPAVAPAPEAPPASAPAAPLAAGGAAAPAAAQQGDHRPARVAAATAPAAGTRAVAPVPGDPVATVDVSKSSHPPPRAAVQPEVPAIAAPAVARPAPQATFEPAAEDASALQPLRPQLREALREARICLAQRRFECTIARAHTVLDEEPGNVAALRMTERARKGQEEALKGDWKMR